MNENTISNGVLCITATGATLIALKALGAIAWSWWIVLIPVFLLAAMLAVSALVVIASAYIDGRIGR